MKILKIGKSVAPIEYVATCNKCGAQFVFSGYEASQDRVICPCCKDKIIGRDSWIKCCEENNNTVYKEYSINEQVSLDFNIPKIHSVMKRLDWKWVIGGEYRVPTEKELLERAIELATDAYRQKTTIATGGIEARYYEDEDGPAINLIFILESIDIDLT